MSDVLLAVRRSLTSLKQARLWFYMLLPALLALFVMMGLSGILLDRLVTLVVAQPPMSWIAEHNAGWLADMLAALGGWLMILSTTYLVAILLASIVVLPMLLRHIAATQYADVARLGRDSFLASAGNSLWSVVIFVLAWLATLPLWLFPGGGVALSVFWMAWLNRRTFAYDVLVAHATPEELAALRKRLRYPLLGLGAIPALLSYLPFIGLLAPSFAALAFVHFGLEALRQQRAAQDNESLGAASADASGDVSAETAVNASGNASANASDNTPAGD